MTLRRQGRPVPAFGLTSPDLGPKATQNEAIQRPGLGFSFGALQGVDLSRLVILGAESAAANDYDSLHNGQAADNTNGSTHYQVPAGRELVIFAYIALPNGNTSGRWVLGHGTAAVSASVAAPAGAIARGEVWFLSGGGTQFASPSELYPVLVRVAAALYPYVRGNHIGARITVYGYERDV